MIFDYDNRFCTGANLKQVFFMGRCKATIPFSLSLVY